MSAEIIWRYYGGHRPPLQLNFLGDFDCELKGGGCLKSRGPRLAPGGRAFDERNELLFQRFLALNRNFVAGDLAGLPPIYFTALLFIIEREIGIFLENADLAHSFGTDPARSHVRHATILETDPGVRDVFAFAQHGNTNRVDAL